MKATALAVIIAFSLLTMTCGGGGGDPLASGGVSNSPGAGRTNEAVDRDNMYRAFQEIFPLLKDIYSDAASAAAANNDDDEKSRIVGNYYGVGYVSVIDSLPHGENADYYSSVEVDFDNYYSNDGKIFFEGKLAFYGIASSSSGKLSKFLVHGSTGLSGDFACTITFDAFSMALQSSGDVNDDLSYAYAKYLVCGPTFTFPLRGTLEVVSKVQSITFYDERGLPYTFFNPYYFDWEYMDVESIPPCTREDSMHYGC